MPALTGHWGLGLVQNPLTDSLYVLEFNDGSGNIPPPGDEFMITETGIFMITESTLDFMITE